MKKKFLIDSNISLKEGGYDLCEFWYYIRYDSKDSPGLYCVHCGNSKVYPLWGAGESRNRKGNINSLWTCGKCKKHFSNVLRTRFEGTRIDIEKWIKAIYLVERYNLTVCNLRDILEVSYKSAWKIKKECLDIIKTRDILKFKGAKEI